MYVEYHGDSTGTFKSNAELGLFNFFPMYVYVFFLRGNSVLQERFMETMLPDYLHDENTLCPLYSENWF